MKVFVQVLFGIVKLLQGFSLYLKWSEIRKWFQNIIYSMQPWKFKKVLKLLGF